MAGLLTEHLVGPLQFSRPGAEVLAAVDSKTTPIALRRWDNAVGFEQLQVARCNAHGFSSSAYVDLLNCSGVHRYNNLVDTTDTV
jgi:hypothetical protein